MEDPMVITSIEWDEEAVIVHWSDQRDQSADSTVMQTTYMRADRVDDDAEMSYELNEIKGSALALLAQWKAWQRQAN